MALSWLDLINRFIKKNVKRRSILVGSFSTSLGAPLDTRKLAYIPAGPWMEKLLVSLLPRLTPAPVWSHASQKKRVIF